MMGLGLMQVATLRRSPASDTAPGPFIGPPGMAPQRGAVRIVVISDLNSQYGSTQYDPEVHRAIALMPQWQPDLVLCGGDMVAAQSRKLSTAQVQAMWVAFDRAIAAPLRQANIPFGFTIGNHDGSGAIDRAGQMPFAGDRHLAQQYWTNPAHNPRLAFVDRGQFPFYYSFQQNDIYYLVWDASTARLAPPQLAWVKQSLASSQAQRAKLRIVIGHLPLYPIAVNRDRPGEFLDQAETLRSLLERYRVHTYVSGHHHAYYPGYRGQLQLLHAGAIGSGPRAILNSTAAPQKTLTVIDIPADYTTTVYTTYDMKTQQRIDEQRLPRWITTPSGTVMRRDIDRTTLGL